jgi:galactose oxidase
MILPVPTRRRRASPARPVRPALAALLAASGGFMLLHGCQDAPGPSGAEPSTSAVATAAMLGKWGSTFGTQIVALHASLVPLGAGGAGVLVWGHQGTPYLWDLSDPAPTFTALAEPAELFCAGHTFLPDGSLLVVGGHDEVKGDGHGIPDAYRWRNGIWMTESSMSFGRWYPTSTTLENGDVITYGGTDNSGVQVRIPERYTYAARSWSQLSRASRQVPYYPRSFLDPKSGTVFYAGEQQPSRWLDPTANGGLGKWSSITATRVTADRNYGSAVMYEPGKILYAGGGGRVASAGIPPTNTAEIIDLNQSNPLWVQTGSMTYPRRQMNATILADGKVLVTGGTSSLGFTNRKLGRKQAEVWDPATGNWTLLAEEAVVRVYHGISLLLPDARVLSAGSGDGQNLPRETTGQIFSPPYLFDQSGNPAIRPVITSVSTDILHYDQSFSVTTPDAASIVKVHLIRFSAVTHAFNQGQTLYRATFSANANGLNVTGPASGRLAPPGPYLLFLVNAAGVPSEARVITLSP